MVNDAEMIIANYGIDARSGQEDVVARVRDRAAENKPAADLPEITPRPPARDTLERFDPIHHAAGTCGWVGLLTITREDGK